MYPLLLAINSLCGRRARPSSAKGLFIGMAYVQGESVITCSVPLVPRWRQLLQNMAGRDQLQS
jgi:hypothetical protein